MELQTDTADTFRKELLAQIPRLRSYAVGLTGSRTEAEDLVQEALMRAWRFRAAFQPGTNLPAWMFRILKNEFLTRRSRNNNSCVEDVDGRLSEQIVTPPEQEWRLHYGELVEALLRLPENNRQALLLVVAAGLSYWQAAQVCGCDPQVLKGRVRRARAQLTELTGFADPAALARRGARRRTRPLDARLRG